MHVVVASPSLDAVVDDAMKRLAFQEPSRDMPDDDALDGDEAAFFRVLRSRPSLSATSFCSTSGAQGASRFGASRCSSSGMTETIRRHYGSFFFFTPAVLYNALVSRKDDLLFTMPRAHYNRSRSHDFLAIFAIFFGESPAIFRRFARYHFSRCRASFQEGHALTISGRSIYIAILLLSLSPRFRQHSTPVSL